jgi:hypothetical protein
MPSLAIQRGQQLGPQDINIFVRDRVGNFTDPYSLTYALFEMPSNILVGPPDRTPVKSGVGQYYVGIQVPTDLREGAYVVRWFLREVENSPTTVIEEQIELVGLEYLTSPQAFPEPLASLIWYLRIRIRDNFPDRNYHFAPPALEKEIQSFSKVFGFIWEDYELATYLDMAVSDINLYPPVTGFRIEQGMFPRDYVGLIVTGAGSKACAALALNWIVDDFSVAGETRVTVSFPFLPLRPDEGDFAVEIEIEDLFKIIQEHSDALDSVSCRDSCVSDAVKVNIWNSFWDDDLKVRSVNPLTGDVELSYVKDVMRHEIPDRKNVKIILSNGASVTCTVDHSLIAKREFYESVAAGDLKVGDFVSFFDGEKICEIQITKVEDAESQEHMYDLSVPGNENFILSNGIVAHNSYSIGGKSLSVDKASKYEAMKSNLLGEFQSTIAAVKPKGPGSMITLGLRQHQFGISARASLGPYSSKFTLSAKSYLGAGK